MAFDNERTVLYGYKCWSCGKCFAGQHGQLVCDECAESNKITELANDALDDLEGMFDD